MPLSTSELEELRAECFADDMAIPDEAMSWTRERATAYFESAGASEKPPEPTVYVVIGKVVNVRAKPMVSATKVGSKLEGQRLVVDAREDGWLHLVDMDGWVLIDGTSLGVGMLLRHASGPLLAETRTGSPSAPTAWADEPAVLPGGRVRLAAPMSYEVVYPYVKVRLYERERARARARAPRVNTHCLCAPR